MYVCTFIFFLLHHYNHFHQSVTIYYIILIPSFTMFAVCIHWKRRSWHRFECSKSNSRTNGSLVCNNDDCTTWKTYWLFNFHVWYTSADLYADETKSNFKTLYVYTIDRLVIFDWTHEEPGFTGRRVSYYCSRPLYLDGENEKHQHNVSLYLMVTSENGENL